MPRGAAEAGIDAEHRFAVGDVDGFRPFTDLNRWPAGPQPPRSPGLQMMYTSGTTGRPKGVRRPLPEGDPDDHRRHGRRGNLPGLRHHHRPRRTRSCAGRCTTRDRSSASRMRCTPATPPSSCASGRPSGASSSVERHHVTNTQMVPTMFVPAARPPRRGAGAVDVSSVESIFHTGAPMPGRREAADDGVVRTGDLRDLRRHRGRGDHRQAGAVARRSRAPSAGRSTACGGDPRRRRPRAAGRRGRLDLHRFRRARRPPSTSRTTPRSRRRVRRGRAFTLGDVGYFDDDGFLFLCDRKIDMVISGGVNIYPAEVEAALLTHDAVADVAVIGVPDDDWGESVKAIVEPSAGAEAGPVLADALVEPLPGANRPVQVPAQRRLRRGAAAPPERQDREAASARALLVRARTRHLTKGSQWECDSARTRRGPSSTPRTRAS